MNFRTLTADEIDCRCSTDGTIQDSSGKTLNLLHNANGYVSVYLKTKNGRKRYLVHRLVAMCFLPNPENKPCVNHKDGNKKNNSVENLEWCTYSENELHSYRTLGKTVPAEHLNKIHKIHADNSSTPVVQSDANGKTIAIFKSQAEASKKTGISQGNISECCGGKRKHAGGYEWHFLLEH